MLSVKSTCKNRCRHIPNEADRISVKHLLTLEEGVLIDKFSKAVQSHLQSLASFISDMRPLSAGATRPAVTSKRE
ncbi:hypothetical protein KZX46_21100 (plasmid) [Polymorphobacter sp. PAMC 29334]|nr:hypothetical protein KZX46_21100 [Polymorphobacter sp. PAMC 29334]